MIKLIVSDIDGTLVPEGTSQINPEVFEVIMRLKREKGIHFAAASGRQVVSIESAFAPIQKEIFYLAENGAYIGSYGRPLFLHPLDRELALQLIEDIRKNPKLSVMVNGERNSYVEENNQELYELLRDGYHYQVKQVADVTKIEETILKVAVYCKGGIQEEVGELMQIYGDVLKLSISGTEWMDCMAPNVSKGEAIRTLQEGLGITPEETVAFGDQMNDLEMFTRAYYSFAVGNARTEVKRAARFQADKHVNHGVLKILKLFLLTLCTCGLLGCSDGAVLTSPFQSEKGYSSAQIQMLATTEKNRYEAIYTKELWTAEIGTTGERFDSYFKTQLQQFMDEMKVMNLLAEEKGISASQQEQSAMEQAAKEYYEALSAEDITRMGITQEEAASFYLDYCVAQKLVRELTDSMNLEVSDSEAKVITLLQAEFTDAETAEEFRKEVLQEGADFERCAAGRQLVCTERSLGRREETKEYEEIVFSLETEEISPVIEENGLCYVVKCINSYDRERTAERKEQIYEQRRQNAFRELYDSCRDEVKIVYSGDPFEKLDLEGISCEAEADFFEIYKKYAVSYSG